MEAAVKETLTDFNRASSTASTRSDFSPSSSICSFDGFDGFDSECEDVPVEDLSPIPAATLVAPCCMRPLQIRVCSWNLNGSQIADGDDITHWLGKERSADILAVGVQELVELKASNVLRLEHGDPRRLAALQRRVERGLAVGSRKVVKVCSVVLAGLALLVYVREELAPFVRQVASDRIKTGFGGMVANKGGVCVRFLVGEVSACFMNMHLPAGTGKANAAKRDRHISKIMSTAYQGTLTCGSFWPLPELKLASHDISVVFGDLNSRPDLMANERGAARPSQACLEADELLMGRFPSLCGFSEGLVSFPPTFRYIPGTDRFSQRSSPAWCDRILFKTQGGTMADVSDYSSFHELRHTSDHRPVAAQLQVSATCGGTAVASC